MAKHLEKIKLPHRDDIYYLNDIRAAKYTLGGGEGLGELQADGKLAFLVEGWIPKSWTIPKEKISDKDENITGTLEPYVVNVDDPVDSRSVYSANKVFDVPTQPWYVAKDDYLINPQTGMPYGDGSHWIITLAVKNDFGKGWADYNWVNIHTGLYETIGRQLNGITVPDTLTQVPNCWEVKNQLGGKPSAIGVGTLSASDPTDKDSIRKGLYVIDNYLLGLDRSAGTTFSAVIAVKDNNGNPVWTPIGGGSTNLIHNCESLADTPNVHTGGTLTPDDAETNKFYVVFEDQLRFIYMVDDKDGTREWLTIEQPQDLVKLSDLTDLSTVPNTYEWIDSTGVTRRGTLTPVNANKFNIYTFENPIDDGRYAFVTDGNNWYQIEGPRHITENADELVLHTNINHGGWERLMEVITPDSTTPYKYYVGTDIIGFSKALYSRYNYVLTEGSKRSGGRDVDPAITPDDLLDKPVYEDEKRGYMTNFYEYDKDSKTLEFVAINYNSDITTTTGYNKWTKG